MNVFIIGAAKAGTTSLYYYLEQHPMVVTPIIKEPHFFSHINQEEDIVFSGGNGRGDRTTNWIYSKEEYSELFKKEPKNENSIILDGAVTNLYSQTAAQEIKGYSPDAKIIIMLRNPVYRAWSHYNHLVRDGREKEEFEKALELEDSRIADKWEFSWHYKKMGLYGEQVKRFYDLFPENQIKVIIFEEFIKNTNEALKGVCSFLKLDPFNFSVGDNHNSSGRSRLPGVAFLVDQLAGYKKYINRVIPPAVTHKAMQLFRNLNTKKHNEVIKPETIKYLQDYFEKSNAMTQSIVNKDLSIWE